MTSTQESKLGLPEPPWDRLLAHLLWDAATRAEAIGEAALADTPLSLASLGLLNAIAVTPGVTIAEMSRRLPKTQQAIGQVAARLEKLGYVERRLRPGRGVGLHVTAAGLQAQREGAAREEALEAHLLGLLGADRYQDLRALLDQLRELLATPQASDGPR